MDPASEQRLEEELRALLNRYSAENESNTPDFILADFMVRCLRAFNHATRTREAWYGRGPVLCDPPKGVDG